MPLNISSVGSTGVGDLSFNNSSSSSPNLNSDHSNMLMQTGFELIARGLQEKLRSTDGSQGANGTSGTNATDSAQNSQKSSGID
ncbi:hypothetical protein [Uliginosibacterium gangwonense]|uniref:hypothetical protein n=1 Tax=Uliginosibacterium gangwonense TaxID=392736 RepID=UPI000365E33D|nr:hypothetical protein [Uliginosibacterium gangwonense]